MRYVVTLRSIDRSRPELVGIRAMDLAVLNDKSVILPLCFVVTSDAMQVFVEHNNENLSRILNNHTGSYDAEIEKAFSKGIIPGSLQEELQEAYESLFVSTDSITAAHLMKTDEDPDLLLVPSADILQESEKLHGIRRSLGTKDDFFRQLKCAWSYLYKRHLSGGVIVQKMINEQICATVNVSKSDDIRVNAHFGLMPIDEIIGSDSFVVNKNMLSITSSRISHQDYKLVREDEGIVSCALKDKGSQQKANDKQVIEMARISKRCSSYLEKDLKIWLGIRGQKTYVFFCNQPEALQKEQAISGSEITIEYVREGVEEQSDVIDAKENMAEVPTDELAKLTVTECPDQNSSEESKDEDIALIVDYSYDKSVFQEQQSKAYPEDMDYSGKNDTNMTPPSGTYDSADEASTSINDENNDGEDFILSIDSSEEHSIAKESETSHVEDSFHEQRLVLSTDSLNQVQQEEQVLNPENSICVRDAQDHLMVSQMEIASHILSVEGAIRKILEQACRKNGFDAQDSISEMISSIRKHTHIPYEQEISKIEMLRQNYDKDPGSISLDDINYAFGVAYKFVKEFNC